MSKPFAPPRPAGKPAAGIAKPAAGIAKPAAGAAKPAAGAAKPAVGAAKRDPGREVYQALGGRVADRYALERQLGAGAMGVVWLGRDDRLERKVAVKILASSWAESSSTRTRFEREARAVAQLRSPHIVEVYDYGIEKGWPFIVMELLDGEELTARLKRRGRLKLEEVGTIVLQTCRALHVAHEAGVIHRDLKPGNIMLDKSTGEEMVKVLDFGVAKRAADTRTDVTKDGMLIGTPQYMAPEQARSVRDLDARADLWSLGVIAYRSLTGRLPFRAKTVVEIVVELCTADFPKPTEICPDLPPAVDGFFTRALAKDRDQRFRSARELAGAYFRMLKRVSPPAVGTDTGEFLAVTTDSGQFLAASEEGASGDDAAPGSDSMPSFPSDSGAFSLSESNPLAAPVAPAGSQPGMSAPGVTTSHLGEGPSLTGGSSGGGSLPSASGAASMSSPTSISAQVGMVDDLSDASELGRGRSKLLPALIAFAALVLAGAAFAVLRAPSETDAAPSAAVPTDGDLAGTPEPEPPPSVAETMPVTTAASSTVAETAETVEEPAPTASATATAKAAVRRPPTVRRPPKPPKPEPTKPPPPGGEEDLLTDRH